MIRLEKVSYQIDNKPLFEDLDFNFPAGSFTLLTGDSGSGKSTLLQLMAGFNGQTYQGKIRFNGQELPAFSMSHKARQVGLMFQVPSSQFTMGTLRKEMIFALENGGATREQIDQAIARATQAVGTAAFLEHPFNQLSGGEKQKCALTVLVAMDAPVLLLDEPFASIDQKSRQELLILLKKLQETGKTLIVTDHDTSGYAQVVDYWVTLTQGQLRARSVAELKAPSLEKLQLSKGENKPALLRLQQVSYASPNGKTLLKPSDFTFKQGITTLTGDNGVGKSTLIRTLVQRHKYQGQMFFQGKRLRRKLGLYQQISLAVQDAPKQFVTMTVAEELQFAKKQVANAQEIQQKALAALGLPAKASLFQLSEGQKKMVQLIGMLTMDLAWLLLDEPFSGLDQRACAYFAQWLQERSKVQNFLVISHRLAPLSGISDHHVVLANQQLKEQWS